MNRAIVCELCDGNIELFKVRNEIWAQAGLAENATACIACVEKKLRRPLLPTDIDMSFPWWGAARPEYYSGVQDGLSQRPVPPGEGIYKMGHELGLRIAGTGKFVVEGAIGTHSPAVFNLTISAYSNYDVATTDPNASLFDDYEVPAFIDTGSRQTLIMPGLLKPRHFGSKPLREDFSNSHLQAVAGTGQIMRLIFSSGMRLKTIELPVFEMRFSERLQPGFVLIGRSVLDQAVFTYDGPKRKATLTFADNQPIKLSST